MSVKRIRILSFPRGALGIVLFLLILLLPGKGSFDAAETGRIETDMPITAPLNEEFLQYLRDPGLPMFYRYSEDGYPLGYLPGPHDTSHLNDRPAETVVGLPTTYDLRTKSKLSSVKNQGGCGSCWAFATYGSMESYLLPGQNWDFSEQNLIDDHGLDFGPCDGGNQYMSAAYLARWSGPVKESDDPYIYSSGKYPAQKRVQDIIFIPKRTGALDNDTLKNAVMTYGAVYVSMYWVSSYYNSTYKSYLNPGTQQGGHAVCIVGWDDNFDRDKFNSTPSGNGAFIVKNSWGSGWGEAGYFYVSYYDAFFARRGESAVFKAENLSVYDTIYQYDPLGWISSLGYSGNDTAWFANIFTAGSTEAISAASFYAVASQNTYEIYVYRDVTGSNPRSGTLVATKTGQINTPGYFTVPLAQSVTLNLNQKFSVVVKLRTHNYNYPIPIEYRVANVSSKATANSGESFISSNGTSWTDTHTSWRSGTNVCLKAMGIKAARNKLTIRSTDHGTTDPAPGDHYYTTGTQVQVTAKPNTNCEFVNWTGSVTGTQNPVTVTMNSDNSIQANFRVKPKLTVQATEHGTTDPAPGDHYYTTGTQVQVTAIPNSYALFTGWTGDVTGSAVSTSLTMNADMTIKANFRAVLPPSNAGGQKTYNRSLLKQEYINILRWEANPGNQGIEILKYRIHLKTGNSWTLFAELNPNVFEHWHRNVIKSTAYEYAIVAVFTGDRDGLPAYIRVQ